MSTDYLLFVFGHNGFYFVHLHEDLQGVRGLHHFGYPDALLVFVFCL